MWVGAEFDAPALVWSQRFSEALVFDFTERHGRSRDLFSSAVHPRRSRKCTSGALWVTIRSTDAFA